jgi:hypothetical protein
MAILGNRPKKASLEVAGKLFPYQLLTYLGLLNVSRMSYTDKVSAMQMQDIEHNRFLLGS